MAYQRLDYLSEKTDYNAILYFLKNIRFLVIHFNECVFSDHIQFLICKFYTYFPRRRVQKEQRNFNQPQRNFNLSSSVSLENLRLEENHHNYNTVVALAFYEYPNQVTLQTNLVVVSVIKICYILRVAALPYRLIYF